MNQETKSIIDYTNKDYDSLRKAMLDLAQEKLPEWTDHSPNDFGVTLVELFAYMGDMLFYHQDRIANESYLETAVERRSVINLLRLIGYELRPSTPASTELTLRFKADATGSVIIKKGTSFKTSAKATGKPVQFQYIRKEPLPINLDNISVTTDKDKNENTYKQYKVKLPVVQVDAVIGDDEILGSSDGSAGQRFRLAQTPLIAEQLEVRINRGAGSMLWQRQDSLLHSRASDQHYRVRYEKDDNAYIEFGDGRTGLIPPKGSNNITATYRTGGGRKGNVPAYTINKLVSGIDDSAGLLKVFNEKAATGGADAESSEDAVLRGPQLFKAQQRAVTATDYEAHAKAFGVSKARARSAGWNTIELYIAPVGGGYPSDTLKEDLRIYLDDKRMMTSLIDIKDPVYFNVSLSGTLEIDAYHFEEQVKQQVSNAIALLLDFETVDFAQPLYLSKIYEAIEAIEGIVSVHVSHFKKVGKKVDQNEKCPPSNTTLPNNGKLEFKWNEIPVATPLIWEKDTSKHEWCWYTCSSQVENAQ